jgi:hypothetical protein
MLRSVLLVVLVLAIAVGGGTLSVVYALQPQSGVGAERSAGWLTYPSAGTGDADPYSRARTARSGALLLGPAEGIVFLAESDSTGEPLRLDCDYVVEGPIPAARLWTLHLTDADGRPTGGTGATPARFNSHQALFLPDGTVHVAVGAHAAPGNWMRAAGAGPATLVLTLYDTPTATRTRLGEVDLPQVIRTGCGG